MAWLRNRGANSVTIPDGRTVTPTDDVQILLNCANIWDKAYTTLTALFADTSTLQAVINSNNAIDYLVRSTTFASGSVPIMTSNTAPSGTCIQNGAESGYYAYSAFDGKDDTSFATRAAIANAYVGYTFPSAKRMVKCKAYVGTNATAESHYTYKIQGSNDGTNWTDLADAISVTLSDHGFTWINVDLDSTNVYTSFRLIHPSTLEASRRMQVSTLQFYEADAVFTEDSTAMSYIGLNNYAANTLLGEYNPNLVPIMTSNTTPSGEASASAEYSSDYKAFKAFDNNDGTRWASNGTTNQYIQYAFANPQEVKKILIRPYFATNSSAKNITIKCSNNGTDWSSLGSYTLENTDGMKTCVLQNTQSATFWRIDIADSYNNRTIAISTIRFYAEEYDSEVWLNAICNSTYFDSVLNAKVPTMTDYTVPSGKVIYYNQTGGQYTNPPWRAFNSSYGGGGSVNKINNAYIGYEFPEKVAVKVAKADKISLAGSGSATIALIASDDKSTWTSLYSSSVSQEASFKYIVPTNDTKYKYYAFRFSSISSSANICGIVNGQFYGRKDV